jgi:D-3-phosphoglycerate dehydrogenase
VLYYDVYRLTPEQEEAQGVAFSDLENLWGRCDVISLHVPLTDDTNRIVDKDSIEKMKVGAVLINTAREELVDIQALVEALASGKLLGAGLDAIGESSMRDKPFADLKNVVLSAHLGGNTADNVKHMAGRCAEQIVAVSKGEKLKSPHVVNSHLL